MVIQYNTLYIRVFIVKLQHIMFKMLLQLHTSLKNLIVILKAGLSTYWAPGLKFYMGPFHKTCFTKPLATLADRYIFFNYFRNCQLHYKINRYI
jgi:hypothetical protein